MLDLALSDGLLLASMFTMRALISVSWLNSLLLHCGERVNNLDLGWAWKYRHSPDWTVVPLFEYHLTNLKLTKFSDKPRFCSLKLWVTLASS